MTETVFFTEAEWKSTSHHKSPILTISLTHHLYLFFNFRSQQFQMKDPSYTCPAARNHVNASLVLSLSQQNDSFFYYADERVK